MHPTKKEILEADLDTLWEALKFYYHVIDAWVDMELVTDSGKTVYMVTLSNEFDNETITLSIDELWGIYNWYAVRLQ